MAMQLEANPQDFDIQTVIGRCCEDCAAVSLAWHNASSQYVAIKRINLENCPMDFSTTQHEVLQHKMLCHPNILPSHCSFVHGNEVWLVTPLMGFGSCRDLLHAHFTEGLPETAIAYILKDVLAALEYLHNRGIIHRSVRAGHMLISATGSVTVSGLRHSYSMMETGRRSRYVHDFPDHYVGSLLWASPELLEQNLAGYDTKSDIYSVGIAACELANGIVPFSDIKATQMLLEKFQGVTPKLLDSTTMGDSRCEEGDIAMPSAFQRTFSSHFHAFVELCLKADSSSRPSATALMQHSFFKQTRRKSQSESLTDLLRPVQPLTMLQLPRDEPNIDSITEALAEAVMDDNSWNFE